MGLKVAICGLWDATRYLIPWEDKEWELWGLAWDAYAIRMDRLFEIHDLRDWMHKPAYIERMGMFPRLYLAEECAEIPCATRFPFEQVAESVGDYWASSIAYMLSLAIHEGAEEIAVYGVAMESKDEYEHQRPNCEYLIGFARARGIKVHIPQESPLCKFSDQFGHSGRYGRIKDGQ